MSLGFGWAGEGNIASDPDLVFIGAFAEVPYPRAAGSAMPIGPDPLIRIRCALCE